MFTRMTNENGQSIDIYENPSEHYTGMNFLPPPTSLLTNPFAIKDLDISPIKKQEETRPFGMYTNFICLFNFCFFFKMSFEFSCSFFSRF